ncbi:MAG: TauD/TfdA family dioxygenase [Nitrospinae bacterium]|nr:TauD/TfdA family dioxygenase [Nitrospinota bacterium]
MNTTPFTLSTHDAYARWRDAKLATAPTSIDDLIVEIADAHAPTPAEIAAIRERVARCNTAIYVTNAGDSPDPSIPRAIMAALSVARFDVNPEADAHGVTSLTPKGPMELAGSTEYIPYSQMAINWHTDGYYNPPDRRIRSLALHCVRASAEGGENDILDHELAYLHLRDLDPALVAPLFADDCMTIPFREDGGLMVRPDIVGPVFLDEAGDLHMRYTHRTRSIVWRDDPTAARSVAALRDYLENGPPHALRAKLAPGMGLVCNNVLHTRSAFTESDRLLYRIRYYDRIR